MGVAESGPRVQVDGLMRSFMAGQISRRRFLYQAMALGVTASGAAALLAACQSAASTSTTTSGAPKRSPALRVAYSGPPNGFDPGKAAISYSHYVIEFVFSTLVALDKNTLPIPDLATSWDVSSDGLTYTFHLRQGVKFHNGDVMTADDVKFTIDRLKDPKTGYPYASYVDPIDHVEVVNPTTVKMVLSKPSAPFLTGMAHPGNSIVPMKAIQGGADMNSHPIGTGPYKFSDYTPGNQFTLLRHTDYYMADKPYFDKFEGHIITDSTARTNALVGGLVDFSTDVNAKDWTQITGNPSLKALNVESGHFHWIGVNLKRKPFDDKNVRLAIGYAIDRQGIVDGAYFGLAVPMLGGTVPRWNWAYDPDLHPFSAHADVAKAKQMLSQSSVPNGFKVTYLNPSGIDFLNVQVPIIQQNLKAIGIDMTIKTLDVAAYISAIFTDKDFEMFNINWVSPLADPDDFTYLDYYSTSSFNPYGYSSKDMDSAIDAGRATTDQAKRKAAYVKAQELQMSDYPEILTVNQNVLHAFTKKLQNYTPIHTGFVRPLRDAWIA
jgi:peptide/nickel transport system substrate-binding protein